MRLPLTGRLLLNAMAGTLRLVIGRVRQCIGSRNTATGLPAL